MLTASSEPCIGTDGQVASSFRENHAYCERRAVVLLDCGVIRPFHATTRQIGLHDAASCCSIALNLAVLGLYLGNVG